MVAKSAGSFLGGILNNPGAIISLVALGGLIIFRKQISEFFQSTFGGLGNIDIALPEITLPSLPEIVLPTLPEITLPTLPPIFTPPVITPPIIIPGPGGNVPPELDCQCGTAINQDAFGVVTSHCIPCGGGDAPFDGSEGPIGPILPPDIIPGIGGPIVINPPIQPPPPIVVDPGIGGEFTGGGSGFIGGSINPITFSCSMSLGEIISAGLASTASEAANLKFINCEQMGSDFDFGTNV